LKQIIYLPLLDADVCKTGRVLVHFWLNRECTQRRHVFYFISFKDKVPLIGLMHDWYDYNLTECSFCHIYTCTC